VAYFLEICDSHEVIIRNGNIGSENDTINLKTFESRGLKTICIEIYRIYCFRTNAIKLGTATKLPSGKITSLSLFPCG